MANATKNYEDFIWNNQMISEKLVNFVRVRIFLRNTEIIFYRNEKLIATDGKEFSKTKKSRRHLKNYSYAIFSTDICATSYFHSYLHIKVYLTDEFDMTKLDNEDFLGKDYVIEAISKLNEKEKSNQKSVSSQLLTPLKKAGFIGCLEKEISKRDEDFETVYNKLVQLAQSGDVNAADELLTFYDVSCIYQAVFWKEVYRIQIAKNQK